MRHLKFLLLPAVLLLAGSAMAGTGVITSISPNQANVSAGAGPGPTVIIRGTNFPVSATSVVVFTIGGNSMTIAHGSLNLKTATRISFVLPTSTIGAGAATVDVQDPPGTSQLTATGTFTFSGNQLQINAKATILSIVSIQWGTNTTADSAGNNGGGNTSAPYSWVIGSTSAADAGVATLSLNTTYTLSNDYTVTVANTSSTGNNVDLQVKCSNAINPPPTNGTDWTLAADNLANDTFTMSATLTPSAGPASAALPLTGGNQEFKTAGSADVPIAVTTQAQFDLTFLSPKVIDKGADTQETITVTITGLKD